MARASEEGPRLDPVHRRTADGAGLRRIHACRDEASAEAEGRAELSGHLHRRSQIRPADLRHDAERDDEAAGGAVSVERDCPVCNGKRLKPEALSVTFAGMDIAEISRLPLKESERPAQPSRGQYGGTSDDHPEKALVVQRIVEDLSARLEVLLDLGLGYLTPERSTPTLVAGRTAAAAPGDAGAIQPVRRGVRPGRAVGGPASGGHRGAAARAGSSEGGRQFAVRGRARTGCRAARRLDRRRRPGRRRARRRDPL